MTNVTRNTRNEAEAVAPTDVEDPANHTVVGRVPRAADAFIGGVSALEAGRAPRCSCRDTSIRQAHYA
jgi:hypothetical protein